MRRGLVKQKKYSFQMFTKSFDCLSSVAEFGVGRSFQTRGPAAAANDLSPNVLLQRGTRQTERSVDLGVRRPE